MGVEYNFTRFGIGTGDDHEAVERRIDADQRGVIVIAQYVACSVLDKMKARLVHGEPQGFRPVGRKRLLS